MQASTATIMHLLRRPEWEWQIIPVGGYSSMKAATIAIKPRKALVILRSMESVLFSISRGRTPTIFLKILWLEATFVPPMEKQYAIRTADCSLIVRTG